MSWILQRPEEEREYRVGEYFAVSGATFGYAVSSEMVRFIESELQRWPRRTWITFVDLNGSRVRVRSRLILQMTQCSVEQRAVDRAFIRGLRREEQDEEAWEE